MMNFSIMLYAISRQFYTSYLHFVPSILITSPEISPLNPVWFGDFAVIFLSQMCGSVSFLLDTVAPPLFHMCLVHWGLAGDVLCGSGEQADDAAAAWRTQWHLSASAGCGALAQTLPLPDSLLLEALSVSTSGHWVSTRDDLDTSLCSSQLGPRWLGHWFLCCHAFCWTTLHFAPVGFLPSETCPVCA